MDPIDLFTLRDLLADLKTRSKHALGQNFLIDENVRTKILEAGGARKGEVILEVGPGLGVLTLPLTSLGASVVAFELDPIMVEYSQKTFLHNADLTVIEGDAVQTLPAYARENLQNVPYGVIANIPYQITSPLIDRLFLDPRGFERPSRAVLLIQYEVAERLAAKPGKSARGAASVLLQAVATVENILTVPPTAFFPSPKVTSAVIKVIPRESPAVAPAEWSAFNRFVRGAFQQRRKQLKNVLAGMLGVSVPDVEVMFTTLNIKSTARAQELTEAEWLSLFAKRQDV